MSATRVLVIGSVDPTGRAGIARDLAVLERERFESSVVVAGLTVQDRNHVRRIVPTEPGLLRESLDAACADIPPSAVKVGLLPDARAVHEVLRIVDDHPVPWVVDPVLHAGNGDALTVGDTLPNLRTLLSRATLATPNVAELSAVEGRSCATLEERRSAAQALRERGARWVLAKGGHAAGETVHDLLIGDGETLFTSPRFAFRDPGSGRGKGCELATCIAGGLARGLPVDMAVSRARAQLQERLQREVSRAGWNPGTEHALRRYEGALARLLASLQPSCVPEVGMNMAYAPASCTSLKEVIGLAGRITIAGDSFAVTGHPWRGGPFHTGRIARAAQARIGRDVWVFNHRFEDDYPGFQSEGHVRLDRSKEPPEASSSMEWMIELGMDYLGRLPALLSDRGSLGKEPMVRVLGESPEELLLHHALLHAGPPKPAGILRTVSGAPAPLFPLPPGISEGGGK